MILHEMLNMHLLFSFLLINTCANHLLIIQDILQTARYQSLSKMQMATELRQLNLNKHEYFH